MDGLKIKRQLVKSTRLITKGKNPARFIGFHETGNPKPSATAQSHADLQTSGNKADVSWQWQVDEIEAIQSFENSQKCWHAGDGINGRGLNETTAVEVCVNGDVKKAWDNAAKLGAYLLTQADDVQANSVDDLRQHFDFSGKNCPELLRAGEHGLSWEWFLGRVNHYLGAKENIVSTPRMVSPVQGRVTSEFSNSRRNPVTGRVEAHLGIDIAAAQGTLIRAAFAGTVVGVGSGLLPGRSGDRNVLIQNPDGERQYYGHCETYTVKKGQKVAAGEVIATVGQRGNATGPHLHFEVHNRNGVARNPRVDFNHFGITPGSKPSVTVAAKPAPKPVKPAAKGSASVRKFQQNLNKYANAGLYVDGVNGKVTKAWVKWVKAAQKTHLPAFRGVGKLVVDGDYGPVVANAVKTLQRRNGLVVDGVLGPVTIAFMRRAGSKIKNRPKNRP